MLLVKLRFRAALHVGASILGEEDTHDYAPSDTLFSALCHAYLAAFGTPALEELLGRFDGEPPFLVSSAFPFHGETLFLPFPRVELPPRAEEEERGAKKRLKESPWVTFENFARLLDEESVGDLGGNEDRLPRKELLPRVALDRDSSNSSIYYMRRAVFPPGGGLWTLLDLKDESLAPALRRTFYLLGEMGLGGERTMGCGFFEPEFEEAPRDLDSRMGGGAPYVALSRVSPERPEEAAEKVDRYALVESKGWIASPTGVQRKRRSVMFFAEGSSFTEKVRGKLLDVTPQDGPGHPVYRYGYGTYLGRAS